jgi:hypothetical protein
MNTTSSQRSAGRRIVFSAILVGIMGLILAGVAETGARLQGHRPWNPEPRSTRLEPEGSFFDPHERYGYAMKPGSYTLILNDALTFQAKHNSAGYRETSFAPNDSLSQMNPQIWVVGGSYTYGWGVADEETFPSQMQKMLPGFLVHNFGVGGYGTLQNLYQLQDLLKQGIKPAYVILAYASFHDQRNTCNRYWMKAIAPQSVLEGLAFPMARLGPEEELVYGRTPVAYTPYPGMGSSAFVHALEASRCKAEESELNSPEVSYRLIMEMGKLCEQNEITFIVAGLEPDDATQYMLSRVNAAQYFGRNIAINREEEGMSLMPHDPHPSPAGQRIYAEKLVQEIQELERVN